MENNKFYIASNYIYLNFKQNFLFLLLNIPLIIISTMSNYTIESFVPLVLAGTLYLPALTLLMYSADDHPVTLKMIKNNLKKFITSGLRMLFISLIFSCTIFFIFFFGELQTMFDSMYLMIISFLTIPILIVTSNFTYYYSQNLNQPILKVLMYTIGMLIKRWYISIPSAIGIVAFAVFFIFNPITFGLFIPFLLAHLVVSLNFIVKEKGTETEDK